jgi:hypothetical protein
VLGHQLAVALRLLIISVRPRLQSHQIAKLLARHARRQLGEPIERHFAAATVRNQSTQHIQVVIVVYVAQNMHHLAHALQKAKRFVVACRRF